MSRAAAFGISPPVRDLKPTEPLDPQTAAKLASQGDRVPPSLPRHDGSGVDTGDMDGALQSSQPQDRPDAMPAPSLTFEGLSSDDNFAVYGSRLAPPSVVGDVGLSQYVQAVNTLVRIFNKSGTALTPPFKQSSLFTSLGGPCAGVDSGDPVVLYDPLADRWLISQFALPPGTSHECIAISRTGDPMGTYYLYDFIIPNSRFPNLPKLGVWPDGYYMTSDDFNQAQSTYLGAGAYAFDRKKMLAGNPTAALIFFDLGARAGGLPSDIDGIKPPPPNTPNYLAFFQADEFLDPADQLEIFEFRANFANPAASTLTQPPPIPVAPFDPRDPAGRADIEQPPPGERLDAIQDRLMFRLAYRNFGSYESLVLNHTVNVSGVNPNTAATHQTGIRYYEPMVRVN